MAGLRPTQEVAGTSDLEVTLGHGQARAQLGVRGDRLEALVRGLGERLVARVEEVRVGAFAASSDAPAQLMQLRQAEGVGAIDDKGIRVGDIQARLDDSRTHKHVELVVPKVLDDGLELVLVHLSVGRAHARLGHQLRDVGGDGGDRVDAVMHVEDLAVAQELASDRGADLGVRVGADEGQDGLAFLGRGLENRHLADAGDRHLEGTRDRRGGHRQDVHVGAQSLERLLVLDTEALLLVDDDEAELLERNRAGQQRVGADDQVDFARGQPSLDLLGFLRGREARERADAHGEAGVALGKGLRVLGDQQGRRHEDGGLIAVLDGLEGGSHRDFGLAVADVAREQAVHGHGLFHVSLDLVDRDELVGGLDVGEGILEFTLPGRVGAEGVPLGLLAHRVQADELLGDLVDGLLGAGLGLGPVGAAHLGQGGLVGSRVLRDLVQRVGGHEEPVGGLPTLGGRVFDDQVVAHRGSVPAPDRPGDELDEASDAVLVVDDVVPGVQGQRVDPLAPARGHAAHVARGGARSPGEVAFGEDRDLEVGRDETDAGLRGRNGHEAGVGTRFHVVRERSRARGVGEDGADAPTRAGAFGGDDDAPAVAGQVGEVGSCAGEVSAVGLHVAGTHAHEGGRDDDGRGAVR